MVILYSSLGCRESSYVIDKTNIKEVDLKKFMGKWYEIARFDHNFERNMVATTAEYTLLDDGMVKVVNSGYEKSKAGKYKISEGKVKCPDLSAPGKLEVSFFLNFYADYWILELDPDYTYALIGSKKNNYLWILSRTPQMEKTKLDNLLSKAKTRGYNIDNLIFVEQ